MILAKILPLRTFIRCHIGLVKACACASASDLGCREPLSAEAKVCSSHSGTAFRYDMLLMVQNRLFSSHRCLASSARLSREYKGRWARARQFSGVSRSFTSCLVFIIDVSTQYFGSRRSPTLSPTNSCWVVPHAALLRRRCMSCITGNYDQHH